MDCLLKKTCPGSITTKLGVIVQRKTKCTAKVLCKVENNRVEQGQVGFLSLYRNFYVRLAGIFKKLRNFPILK